jgi:hypothetical protein
MAISLLVASAVAVVMVDALDEGSMGAGDGVDLGMAVLGSMVTPKVTGSYFSEFAAIAM